MTREQYLDAMRAAGREDRPGRWAYLYAVADIDMTDADHAWWAGRRDRLALTPDKSSEDRD